MRTHRLLSFKQDEFHLTEQVAIPRSGIIENAGYLEAGPDWYQMH